MSLSRLEKLQEFLAKDPNDSFTRYAIGLEFGKEKKYTEATKTLEELRRMDANYVPTYYMLAGFYREAGEKEKALEIYKVGLSKAREVRDLHAASELEAAMDELEDEL